MRILDRNVYLGPNLWANFRVIRLTLDLGELENWPSAKIGGGFIDGLMQALPGLNEHGCSYRETGGFLRRLREDDGTWLGHVLEHVALELQCVAGTDVTFGRTRSQERPGHYDVVFEYEEESVGLEAAQLALKLLISLLPKELVDKADINVEDDFDWDDERDTFIRYAQRNALGPSTASLIKAASDRDIPWLRLNRYSLVQFGHGKFQKRIQATVTGETRHIAVELASDKEETNQILSDLGLPVPRQRLVYSARQAARAADRIGFPVVVKPLNANHGRGVSINLEDAESVATAFDHAREHSRSVIVESFIEGLDHRLLVINGELVAASKRVPGHVKGDGVKTIAELVEEVNSDPRRGVGHEKVLTRLEMDHQAKRLLQDAGLTEQSVPAKGDVIYLRSTGNLSTGGTAVDVTDVIHPDNRAMAIRSAKAIGLDVAGIDFLTTDITKSYSETNGAICEVNAAPGFRMHVAPSEGTPRDAAGPVIDMLFPEGAPSRVPIATITGTNGKTTVTRMVSHILKMAGKSVGMTTTDGVYVDGNLTVPGDMTGPVAARIVMRDPSVEVAVLETARGGLIRAGMGYGSCNVGVVLNVQSDHLGLKGVNTLDELALIKRIPIEVAKDCAVLNADDRRCLEMASHTKADSLCYVTMNSKHELVREHIRSGGRAMVLEEGLNGHMITLYDGVHHMPLLWTHLIPATLEGRAMHNVQNAMFAAATAFAMNTSLDEIRHGLRTFDTSFFQVPGRMNVFDEHPFKVIMDYGHNPAAVTAMVNLSDRLDVRGQRTVVLAAPGDRRDEDVREIAQACAGHFDHYICREDDTRRGREVGEVAQMLCSTLIENGVGENAIRTIPDEQESITSALSNAKADDLLLIFVDNITRSWKQVIHFTPGEELQAKTESSTLITPMIDDAASVISKGDSFIKDERGVRLVSEDSD